MAADIFAERLAKVRDRFISTLENKIEETYAALTEMTGDSERVIATVGESYRRVHGICGTGPTVGFVSLGDAARKAEAFLIDAYRAQRGLSEEELAGFTEALHALRDAARRELEAALAETR